MQSFIGSADSIVVTTWAKKERVVEELSQAGSYSCKLEDKVASLHGQVDSLRYEVASSLEEASWYQHEAEAIGAKRDSLATRLNQLEREIKELKKVKADYAARLLNLE